jgi:hypothetical protein
LTFSAKSQNGEPENSPHSTFKGAIMKRPRRLLEDIEKLQEAESRTQAMIDKERMEAEMKTKKSQTKPHEPPRGLFEQEQNLL